MLSRWRSIQCPLRESRPEPGLLHIYIHIYIWINLPHTPSHSHQILFIFQIIIYDEQSWTMWDISVRAILKLFQMRNFYSSSNSNPNFSLQNIILFIKSLSLNSDGFSRGNNAHGIDYQSTFYASSTLKDTSLNVSVCLYWNHWAHHLDMYIVAVLKTA